MKYTQALEVAVARTVEEMLFQCVQPSTQAVALDDCFWASVQVTSPAELELELAVAADEARSLASLLYGDPGVTDAAVADFVAEICNTVAGTMARELADDQPLALCPPRLARAVPNSGQGTAAWFAGDDTRLWTRVTVSAR